MDNQETRILTLQAGQTMSISHHKSSFIFFLNHQWMHPEPATRYMNLFQLFQPLNLACPVKFFGEKERSEFNRGTSEPLNSLPFIQQRVTSNQHQESIINLQSSFVLPFNHQSTINNLQSFWSSIVLSSIKHQV